MEDRSMLSQEEGRALLRLARETIKRRLEGQTEPPIPEDLPPPLRQWRGNFVTLTQKRRLRGCIGHIVPQGPLCEGVRENALNAAFRDPRFPPLTKAEWDTVKLEVSVLSEPRPLTYRDAEDLLAKLQPGKDGVIIKKGRLQATFLPQVWEQLPGKEEFLTHLCLKAGLDGDAWRKELLEVSTYQIQAFEE